MNKENIIIYDIANIDSTLAAAWAAESLKRKGLVVIAFPASNKITIDANAAYYWIGVEPSSETLAFFLQKTNNAPTLAEKFLPKQKMAFKRRLIHAGFYPENKLNGNAVYMTDVWTPSSINKSIEVNEIPVDTLLQDSVMTAVFNVFPVPTGAAWSVTRNVVDFQYNLRQLSIADQAAIYKNYISAIDTLSHGVDFSFQASTDDDERIYLDFMKNVKRQVTTVFETSPFTVDGQVVNVPMINVNQTLSPWVLKLLSNHYPYAVTYEQRRQKSIFTVFGKYAGFEDALLKEMRANKISCRLSNQL